MASMCWTLLTLGLVAGSAVLWRGNSSHSNRLEIGGMVLLVVAVIIAVVVG
jgi:hypothetical protein